MYWFLIGKRDLSVQNDSNSRRTVRDESFRTRRKDIFGGYDMAPSLFFENTPGKTPTKSAGVKCQLRVDHGLNMAAAAT